MAEQNTAPTTVTLSVQLVNAIYGYLGNQPFAQVRQLIEGIEKEASGQLVAPEAAPAEDTQGN
jgi:hypothetical protein